MSSYPPPPGHGFGERIEDVIARIQFEVKQAAQYVNDAVVPQVRKESVTALRTLGETLKGLADKMDKSAGPKAE
jgi:hypothetical protein